MQAHAELAAHAAVQRAAEEARDQAEEHAEEVERLQAAMQAAEDAERMALAENQAMALAADRRLDDDSFNRTMMMAAVTGLRATSATGVIGAVANAIPAAAHIICHLLGHR